MEGCPQSGRCKGGAERFCGALQVRTVPVETRCVALSDLRVPPPRREELRSVEASLRLDALASAGQEKKGRGEGGAVVGIRGYRHVDPLARSTTLQPARTAHAADVLPIHSAVSIAATYTSAGCSTC